MLQLLLLVLSICLTWVPSNALYPMVLAHPRLCTNKLDHIWMTVTDYGFESMYIDPDNPQPMVLGFDMCLVPSEGSATVRSSESLGLATKEAAVNVDEDDMVIVKVRMSSSDCEKLTGNPATTPGERDDCEFYIVHQNDSSNGVTQFTDIMPLAGTRECPNQAATVVLPFSELSEAQCEALGGTQQGSECELDLCYGESEVTRRCVPSDAWSPVKRCANKGSRERRCKISYEEGMLSTRSSSPQSREVITDLKRIFRQSLSTDKKDADWATAIREEATWSEGRKRTTEVNIPVGKTLQVEQLVGYCGDTSVKTRNLRTVEQPNGRTTRITTRKSIDSPSVLFSRWRKYIEN